MNFEIYIFCTEFVSLNWYFVVYAHFAEFSHYCSVGDIPPINLNIKIPDLVLEDEGNSETIETPT